MLWTGQTDKTPQPVLSSHLTISHITCCFMLFSHRMVLTNTFKQKTSLIDHKGPSAVYHGSQVHGELTCSTYSCWKWWCSLSTTWFSCLSRINQIKTDFICTWKFSVSSVGECVDHLSAGGGVTPDLYLLTDLPAWPGLKLFSWASLLNLQRTCSSTLKSDGWDNS